MLPPGQVDRWSVPSRPPTTPNARSRRPTLFAPVAGEELAAGVERFLRDLETGGDPSGGS